MTKIDIKHFELANERVTEPISLYIELHDDFLIYAGEYYADVPVSEDSDDHSLGWKNQFQSFKIKIKKSQIVSVEIRWLPKREVWSVELEANGYPNTFAFYFETEIEADTMYYKLDKYIFEQ